MNQARSADGTAIALDRVGEGPPIILVGAAYRARSDPKLVRLATLLAPRHTVFNYDRRGAKAQTRRRARSSARSRISKR
jgi:hypothetical protein